MQFISTANARRPQVFSELQGQDFIVSTIENSIKNNHFAHAYLFSGPRGVGKTTSARLLAKALNCVNGPTSSPCGECPSCVSIAKSSSMDCIEIDGASNTSVDDIRKIKSDIMYPPTQSRYKIYIIDEVHMLSISAFNALLKTIEEPPEYVIFIFATTEIQKVPETIKSRCQFFQFKAIDSQVIMSTVKKACDDNGVKIDEESLLWLAKEAKGSMRDAYTLYDQLVSFSANDITFDKIKSSLHLSSTDEIEELYKYAFSSSKDKCLDIYFKLKESGVTNEQFLTDLAEYLRAILLYKNSVTNPALLYIPKEKLNIPEVKNITSDKIEIILGDIFSLYRHLKDSINPDFEIELFVARFANIQNMYSNFAIAKRLSEIKNELTEDDSSSANIAAPTRVEKSSKVAKEPKKIEKVVEEKKIEKEPANEEYEDDEDKLKAIFGDALV